MVGCMPRGIKAPPFYITWLFPPSLFRILFFFEQLSLFDFLLPPFFFARSFSFCFLNVCVCNLFDSSIVVCDLWVTQIISCEGIYRLDSTFSLLHFDNSSKNGYAFTLDPRTSIWNREYSPISLSFPISTSNSLKWKRSFDLIITIRRTLIDRGWGGWDYITFWSEDS